MKKKSKGFGDQQEDLPSIESKQDLKGLSFLNQGNFLEAEKIYRKLFFSGEGGYITFYRLATICRLTNRLDEMHALLKRCIEINPNGLEAHHDLAKIYLDNKDFDKAILHSSKAIEIKKDCDSAYNILGNSFLLAGNAQMAMNAYEKAIKYNSSSFLAHHNLGVLQEKTGDISSSILSYEMAVQYNKNYSIAKFHLCEAYSKTCQWEKLSPFLEWLSNIGIEENIDISPLYFMYIEDNPGKMLVRTKNIFNKIYKVNQSFKPDKRDNSKIKIGYFSADYGEHPVSILISEVFELHDRSKFEVYGYGFSNNKNDKYSIRIKESFDFYRELDGISDDQACNLIRGDNLDIAIDLMGYTMSHRIKLFSKRIAPIQINYLGYPGTTGSDQIDYIIADRIVIPKESKKFYSEKVLYMPTCYMCFDSKRKFPKMIYKKKDLGIPNNSFLMTGFHQASKITSREFNCWLKVMIKVEESILWLRETNTIAKSNLKNKFLEQGISDHRLIFAERLNSSDQNLSRYLCADLFLDTFNYNAHSTAIECLWCGLPVLTLIGESFSSRVGASLLSSLDLNELIAYTEDEYIEKAIYFAKNPKELKRIKSRLAFAKDNNDLFNPKVFTKNLENIFANL